MRLLVVLLLLTGLRAAGQEAAPTPDPFVAQRRLAQVLRQATAEYDRGDYQAVIERLGALTGPLAGDLSVLNVRAAALTKAGQYEQAKRIFTEIIRANPKYFPAAFNLGEVQFMEGDREGALATYSRLQQSDPRNELLRFKVFLCLSALGRRTEAAKTAAALHAAGLTPAWYYARVVVARQSGDEKSAGRHLRAAHDIYGEKACRPYDDSLTEFKP